MLDLLWNKDDTHIFSSDDCGAIYEWDIATGKRLFDCVEKEFQYVGIAADKETSSIIALSKCGHLREVIEGNVLYEKECGGSGPFTSLSSTNLNPILLAGDFHGSLYDFAVPINEPDSKNCRSMR